MAARILKEGLSVSFLLGEQFHRIGDQPAYVRENAHGVIVAEEYWINGQRHRDVLPALIHRNANGEITRLSFYCRGELHRDDDLPACVLFKDGIPIYESYWRHDVLHRERHQPAIIKRICDASTKTAKIKHAEYYVNGEQMDAQEERRLRVVADAIGIPNIE